jgi:cytoskeleton protein RodZ
MNDELTPEPAPPAANSIQLANGMDEADAAASRSGPDTEPPPSRHGPATAGGMIREARQAQGIDLASLAAMLKIPLRRLEALESDRHDELQGPTFERALAQAACRVLKIDPKPVLALLPQHERNTLERVSEGINAPFRDGQGSGGFEVPTAMRPVLVLIVLLLVAALVLAFLPQSWVERVKTQFANLSTSAPAESAAPAPAAPSAAATGTITAPVELAPATAATPASSAPAVAAPAASGAARAASVAPQSAPAASATAAQDVDEVLAHVAPTPSIPLQVVASADSWVEVVDAHGRTLLSRTVVAGESVGLDGAMPMHVKVGNASGTHLKLRGDNVDLTPWTRDNVARLELK